MKINLASKDFRNSSLRYEFFKSFITINNGLK